MIRSGHISSVIQLTDLRNVNPEAENEELRLSKSILEQIICKDVVSFSFGYGSHDAKLFNLALDCGYNFVYTTLSEIITFPLKRRSSVE
jgi:hypothetical protein